MKTKDMYELLDECVLLSDDLLEAIKMCILKLGRNTHEGELLLDETWPHVHELMQLKSKYNELKKTK